MNGKSIVVIKNGRKYQIVNINLSDIDDDFAKSITKVFSRIIFDYAKGLNVRASIPFHIIVEEAHRYIQNDNDRFLLGYNIFERIAKEGRKYGVILGIITQRPVELSDTVISQCSNFLIFRINHPVDVEYIRKMVPNISDEIVEKQKNFPDGGITFSGGEPTLQAKELIPLFESLREAGIHICLDTNGGVWNEYVEKLLTLTDLPLLDIKQFNTEKHRALTERSNEPTLKMAAWLEEHNRPFWMRYVLVPGYSDAEEDIRALGEALGGYKCIERVEILPYHRLGVHKYEAMGLEYKLADVKENTHEQLERAEALFKEYFDNVIVN